MGADAFNSSPGVSAYDPQAQAVATTRLAEQIAANLVTNLITAAKGNGAVGGAEGGERTATAATACKIKGASPRAVARSRTGCSTRNGGASWISTATRARPTPPTRTPSSDASCEC